MNRKKIQPFLMLPIAGLFCGSATGQLLITQYYEGPSGNNKYIELTNVSAGAIDLSGFSVTSWANGETESFKTAGTTPNNQEVLSGMLAGGASFLISNPSSTTPIAAAAANITSTVTFINGDDSIVLYQGTTIDPVNIIDAVSFTDAGNEGADVSFVRQNTAVGFNLTAGSTVLDFPSVWASVSTDDVDNSSLGDDIFLGSSALGSTSPLVRFTSSNALVGEADGTIDLELEIRAPDGDAVSVDIAFDDINSTASTADIGGYTTQTVTFPAGAVDGDTQTITVTLTDDTDEEASEVAIFTLGNLTTTGGAILGGATSFDLNLQDDDTVVPPIYISEIADPSDLTSQLNARFVELFNPTAEPIDLDAGGWTIVYYANGNSGGSEIPLLGSIPAGGTYIIANSLVDYATAYPGAPVPNLQSGTINSNGDDNIELRFGGAQGAIVDVYGMPGTDGTGESWEFVDSRVDRVVSVPNSVFTIAEWTITPAAAADMTPGVHNGGGPIAESDLKIVSFSIDLENGRGVINATGLGTKVWVLESSTDLNQVDSWAPVPGGANEVDQADGSVNFVFFFAVGEDIEVLEENFYRLVEAD